MFKKTNKQKTTTTNKTKCCRINVQCRTKDMELNGMKLKTDCLHRSANNLREKISCTCAQSDQRHLLFARNNDLYSIQKICVALQAVCVSHGQNPENRCSSAEVRPFCFSSTQSLLMTSNATVRRWCYIGLGSWVKRRQWGSSAITICCGRGGGGGGGGYPTPVLSGCC